MTHTNCECIDMMHCGTGRNMALLRVGVGRDGEVIGVDASAWPAATAPRLRSQARRPGDG
jgi:hypothetical protein